MGDDSAELQNAAVIIEKKKRCIALKERKDDLLSDYRKTLLNYNKLKKFEEVPCRSFGIKSTVMGAVSGIYRGCAGSRGDARLILLSFFGAAVAYLRRSAALYLFKKFKIRIRYIQGKRA